MIKNAPLLVMCPSEAVFCLVGSLDSILLIVCDTSWVANDVFLTMVFRVLWALTTLPYGCTEASSIHKLFFFSSSVKILNSNHIPVVFISDKFILSVFNLKLCERCRSGDQDEDAEDDRHQA